MWEHLWTHRESFKTSPSSKLQDNGAEREKLHCDGCSITDKFQKWTEDNESLEGDSQRYNDVKENCSRERVKWLKHVDPPACSFKLISTAGGCCLRFFDCSADSIPAFKHRYKNNSFFWLWYHLTKNPNFNIVKCCRNTSSRTGLSKILSKMSQI